LGAIRKQVSHGRAVEKIAVVDPLADRIAQTVRVADRIDRTGGVAPSFESGVQGQAVVVRAVDLDTLLDDHWGPPPRCGRTGIRNLRKIEYKGVPGFYV
jgi:hypothetical protein